MQGVDIDQSSSGTAAAPIPHRGSADIADTAVYAVRSVMPNRYEAIRAYLEQAESATTKAEALQNLRSVLTEVGQLLDEQLASAVVDDEMSLAAAGKHAGLTENAVGPRLANTARLAPYATSGGRVTAEDVKRARQHKYARTPLPPEPPAEPMRFKPRRTTKPS
ncbi:hypothetical protein C6A87_000260 [Mycobacterium sp. ITM-2016-00317]|uniref:hypothetical protein n=1 Tax=Mycobacterium sp. ITM-2016-00317 TaxID=2099694 RepID=UPI00287F417B|nr:hypothetical protein [Mycobacterium sp. ITM-2016-00317]WNG87770.1 hypothetical protein C6A87_000260 [Mycobacterium sp. ITM-2016-00317]